MKRVLLSALLLVCVAGGANADPTNLALGVFIAHYVPELGYSASAPALGWCGEYAAHHAISSAGDQNNRIDVATSLPASWFVLAAWHEEKEWCGTDFGFGQYDPSIFAFAEYNACFPQEGLEIATPGWPGPGEGIAFVVTGEPWQGNFVTVMHFGGYAYAYAGPGLMPLDVDPVTGFAGTGNCLTPPELFEAVALGGMGINMEGIWVGPMPLLRVCCDPETGACLILTEEDCLAMGWEWYPDLGECCDPNPCLPSSQGTTSWGSIKALYQ